MTISICRYIYYEEVHLTSSNVMAVMYASKMYILPVLTEKCKEFLLRHMCTDNVCTILEQSVLYSEEELIQRCLTFIAPIVGSIFLSKDFMSLSQPSLKTLLQSKFYCHSEIKVYEACLQWAKKQCLKKQMDCNDENMRSVLGDAIYQIRFTSMQDSEFVKIAKTSEILTDKEKVDIFVFKAGDQASKEDSPENSKFAFEPRPNSIIVGRFKSIKQGDKMWCYNKSRKDAIAFRSNKNVMLVGLFVFGGTQPDVKHLVNVEIKDSDLNLLSELSEKWVMSDGCNTPKPIHLSNPVSILPDQSYHVIVTIKGPLTYYGCSGDECLTIGSLCVEFFNSDQDSNNTTIVTGQIPMLKFDPIE